MAKMLDVLEAFLNLHGHVYMRLDGSTKPEQRQVRGMQQMYVADTADAIGTAGCLVRRPHAQCVAAARCSDGGYCQATLRHGRLWSKNRCYSRAAWHSSWLLVSCALQVELLCAARWRQRDSTPASYAF
jgi:hypothetical protein